MGDLAVPFGMCMYPVKVEGVTLATGLNGTGSDPIPSPQRQLLLGQMQARGMNQVVTAEVPLSEMFAYSNDLRSRTAGRATYTMQFHSYQQTPGNVQEEIVQRIRGE